MSKLAKVGNILVGADNPVTIQTMYDRSLRNIDKNFKERMINLKLMGCDLIRFSFPNINEKELLEYVVKNTPMPVIADIHYDYRNALTAIECNVAAIRINPGNIGAWWKTVEIIKKASDYNCAVRIGLNSGSLPLGNNGTINTMVNSALEYIDGMEKMNFHNIIVSLKSSDEKETIEANKLFHKMSDYPIHLGLTEAGGVISSCIRSTWVLASLLTNHIGDTLRYSISGSIEDEVLAGAELLRMLGLRNKGIRLISCPTCGRNSFNTIEFLNSIYSELAVINKDITVAIMGCVVNGPGEAKNANLAVCGIGNKVYIYKDGSIITEIDKTDAKKQLLKQIEDY